MMNETPLPDKAALVGATFKVLDHGFVRVIDYMGDDHAIAEAARVGRQSDNPDARLIAYMMRHEHTSPFEQAEIKLGIGAPVYIARQWLRYRTAHVNEISARYSVLADVFHIPDQFRAQGSSGNRQASGEPLDPALNDELRERARAKVESDYRFYTALLDAGVAREQARIFLPFTIYTTWFWKIDAHNLLRFLKHRLGADAQSEITEYARVIEAIVKSWLPITYASWREVRGHV